jgi:hypothetical protein
VKTLEKQGDHLLSLAVLIPMTLAAADVFDIYGCQLAGISTSIGFLG